MTNSPPNANPSASNTSSCGCAPGCCGTSKSTLYTAVKPTIPPQPAGPSVASANDELRQQVRAGYAQIAKLGVWTSSSASIEPTTDSTVAELVTEESVSNQNVTAASSCCGSGGSSTRVAGGGCCGPANFTPQQLAHAIGYAQGDLALAPEGSNMGLSCGNPTAIASLKPGETVLDLGSGGGFDCFIAGPKVGSTGRVIGVDMTPDMVSKARRNTASYASQTGLNNVEFRLGEIEHLPVADASVDVVISNCVLNLSPDKPQVWREIARVLKPGGRAAISDLALLRPLPESIRADVEALVGCIAGAPRVDDLKASIIGAGLRIVSLTAKPQYVEALSALNDPLYVKIAKRLPEGTKPSDFITSLDILAVKG
ncbi:MAG: arsenite methyltransferase [Phycisphaerales bacterium]|nr:arsenite methyltransferase [Phycisphaerales bacterium]